MRHGAEANATAPPGPALHAVGLGFALAISWTLTLSTAASAQQERVIDCENALSQNDMTACAWRAAEKADADMAAALAKARKTMEAIDRDVSEARPNPAGAVEALEQSQRGWLEYREGRCTIKGFDERGGSMEPMVVGDCHEEMARARIAELDALVEE
jgi:uncharacterized protein YecT (DUF1311 family)